MDNDDIYSDSEDSFEIKYEKLTICNTCNSCCSNSSFKCEGCLEEKLVNEFNYFQCCYCDIKMFSCDECSKIRKHFDCRFKFLENEIMCEGCKIGVPKELINRFKCLICDRFMLSCDCCAIIRRHIDCSHSVKQIKNLTNILTKSYNWK